MGHPADDEGIDMEPTATRQDTAMSSEKHDFEKDVETTQMRPGLSAHIDEAVAARIAENVDDFMVST